jgi:phosphotransferase system HPr-like phosphotransfer protein
MNKTNEDFTAEDILTGLYKLASIGAAKSLNIDLTKLEELSGRKLKVSSILTLAMLGSSSDDEIEFVRVCAEALKPRKEQ